MVPKLMEDYFAHYEQQKDKEHPVLLAADMHERLVTIHPFVDGNGRTARMVMNLILLQHGFPVANISSEPSERQEYYDSLETAQTGGGQERFQRLILQTVKSGLIKYLDVMSPDVGQGKGKYYLETISPYLESSSE